MTSASKLFVAPGHNHWLPKLRARLRSKQPSAEVLVVEFQDSSGRIGFDLNTSGQALFRNLVGGAHSWSPKKGHATQLGEQDATDYVRSLVVDGLSTPITLSKAAPDDAGSLRDLRTLEFLSSVDPDEQDDKFCEGIEALLSRTDSLCIHSIPQWITTVVVRDSKKLLDKLRTQSVGAGVEFVQLKDETALPQW